MADEVTQILLDGMPVWARVSAAEELGRAPGKYADTGFADRVASGVEGLSDLVQGVARTMRDATRAAAPDQVSVSFGVELTAKAGKVIGLLADAEGKAAITVTLTWGGGSAPAEGAAG